jgi:hypothetical protein
VSSIYGSENSSPAKAAYGVSPSLNFQLPFLLDTAKARGFERAMRNANPNIREAKVSKACGCLMAESINQRRWFKCSVVQTAIAKITMFSRVVALCVTIAVIRRIERVEL